MKKLMICMLGLVLLAMPVKAKAETLTIVADVWCPYNCEPGGERQGFMIDIATEAFKRHGIEVKYLNMPWSRAIEETRQMKYDAIVGGLKSDAPDFIYPDMPLGKSDTSFFVKKGNPWRYEGVDKLEKISLGVINDYSYGDDLDEYIRMNKNNLTYIQTVSGDNALEMNLKKLISGRVGAIIDDSDVTAHYISQHPELRDQIESAGMYSDDDIYMAFSPKNPNSKKYADILSQEITAMRASGDLQKILAAYNLTDFAPAAVDPAAAVPATSVPVAPVPEAQPKP